VAIFLDRLSPFSYIQFIPKRFLITDFLINNINLKRAISGIDYRDPADRKKCIKLFVDPREE